MVARLLHLVRPHCKTIGLCGTNGTKFPAIREHMRKAIADKYTDMDTRWACTRTGNSSGMPSIDTMFDMQLFDVSSR